MKSPAEHLELVAADVATEAARLVAAASATPTAARTKTTPTDVVTHTDLESESFIRRELRARCPGSAIIGEEYEDGAGNNRVGWIVDPIDGTVNFLYGLPVVSVSVAATIDGHVVAGAVADVHRREVFSAARDRGARRDGEAIRTSGATQLEQSLVGTGFAYESNVRAEQATVVGDLLPRCRDIRCMGSAALNLCWVACGRLDGYYERDLKVYDYAAGALIAVEAGARVRPPDDSDVIVAADPGIWSAFEPVVVRS